MDARGQEALAPVRHGGPRAIATRAAGRYQLIVATGKPGKAGFIPTAWQHEVCKSFYRTIGYYPIPLPDGTVEVYVPAESDFGLLQREVAHRLQAAPLGEPEAVEGSPWMYRVIVSPGKVQP